LQDTIFWITAGIVMTCAVGSLACAALFLAKLLVPRSGSVANIVLLLPATGSLDNLEDLLAALGRQSVRARRLIIAVESPDDPAYRRATELEPRLIASRRSMSSWPACLTAAVRNAPTYLLR
jgi:hypothetical protein